jgi:hypothetical protein
MRSVRPAWRGHLFGFDVRRSAIRRFHSAMPGFQARMDHLCLVLLVLVAALMLPGCGGAASSDVKSVAITPTSASVPINGTADFTATITLVNSSTSITNTVTWEVNGTAGGSSTFGTIVGSTTDNLVGVYTAPASVPTQSSGVSGLQIGQVSITAVAQQTTTSTTTTEPTVTSNAATVTIGSGLGLAITSTSPTVPAGGTFQFQALLNSLADPDATWSVTSASGSTDPTVIGTIGATTGLYTAPDSPPPGGTLTVTATDPAATAPATATVTIIFSDDSLRGPYAFGYSGNDNSGFMAVAGSFVTNGAGQITSGVEDIESSLSGLQTQVAFTGTYTVGADGRGSAQITHGRVTENWRFALATSHHAQLTRFDSGATGGGTMDQQSLEALSNQASVISGPYAFTAVGADENFNPLGIAGEFSADGAGHIPSPGGIIDVNDNGLVTADDTSLNGTYAFDTVFSGTGRGTLSLESTATGATARQYAFYAVGANSSGTSITQMYVVEIDGTASVAGQAFSAPTTASLGNGDLSQSNYVFVAGGASSAVPYASGGVLTSDGAGNITGGVLDVNNNGSTTLATALGTCAYSLDSSARRIDLRVFAGSGMCPVGANPSVSEFAAYQTSLGSVVMLEVDPAAVTIGVAYQQCGPLSTGCAAASPSLTAASVDIGLIGQGIFHSNVTSVQQNASGQLSISSAQITSGNLDINTFPTPLPQPDPVSSVSLGSPTNGRGTVVVSATSPTATYNLIYYLIDDHTALLLDQDQTQILVGATARQF